MYLDFFGLKELPFSIAPDPRYLYMSERHREALAHLLFGVSGQGGFVVLTGEVGTGKTTICRCFLNQVPSNTDVAFVINPKLSARELLASICDELDIEYSDSASIKVLNDAINQYLLRAHGNGRHTVLIVDEAQNLRVDVLEQLRLLTNLETSEKKLLQIILLGQPELRDMLAKNELRQLAQRITARYHLDALNRVEVGSYLKCRLSVAGRAAPAFSKAAVNKIYQLSGGIPRLINLIADRSLLGAYANHSELAEPVHVKQAYREIQGEGRRRLSAKQRKHAVIGAWVLSVSCLLGMSVFAYTKFYQGTPFEDLVAVSESRNKELSTVSETFDSKREVRIDSEAKGQQAGKSESGSSEYLEGFEEALSNSGKKMIAYQQASSPETMAESSVENLEVASRDVDKPASTPGFPFLESLLDKRNSKNGVFLAYQSLFKQWGVFYPQEPFMLACQFAELNDLKCLHKQGNWRSLLRLDRPAVLSLLNENGEALVVTLLRIEGDRARIALNGELMWVTMDEVDRHWLGEYSVLYRVPPYRSHNITPGQPNEDQWLQAQLQKVSDSGLLQGFSIGLGRRPLSSIIEDFQRAVGLVPDGIAGSMTIIHLNTVLDAGSPSLLGKG
jgi:general secretion pathway protein A